MQIKRTLRRVKSRLLTPVLQQNTAGQRSLILLGKQASETLKERDRLTHLSEAEFKVFSQWGEDGILEWLIQRLPISSKRFIEFGVQDYNEANTRFLLVNRNWKGLILDSSPDYIQKIRDDDVYWRHDLTAVCAFVNRDNINELFRENGFLGKIGILSIDIDGNDYWVWESISVIDPDIVICEYNAVFGDVYPVSVPYDEKFHRTTKHHSNLYFGASVKALHRLALSRGYEMVGSNQSGCNAFFVRRDLFPLIEGKIADKAPCPSLARESRDASGKLTFISGLDRFSAISHLPVVQVETTEQIPLKALGDVYSRYWLNEMHTA